MSCPMLVSRFLFVCNFSSCVAQVLELTEDLIFADSDFLQERILSFVVTVQIGWCYWILHGGALSIASSVLVPEVDAVVAFYGVPSSELADPAHVKAPVQAHFGELDSFVGFSDVTAAKALEEKLKASGVPHEVHIYPGNAHAFMNTSPDGVKRRKGMGLDDEDEAAAELAWSRFRSWMSRYLSP
ncbi:alpha/beta-Hydrolases superfamily protein [Actinidia rufa]|uniref:Alpha/beta-Hydrolases superfamily protein n=1 Tax=Actinidia rufa TaxID=165716 RepID=A0A7J0FGJ8_9ERIC|nr:alpha/beta-Hydrolases superfamily protein [Actinidia rufa]